MQREEKKPVEKPPEPDQLLRIVLDANKARLSHIVHLKKLFNTSAGTAPVQIDFKSNDKILAEITIDTGWGVTLNSQLESGLKQIPSLLQCGIVDLGSKT